MSFKGAKFGFGPKELGGSVDLINHYRLRPHHEFFCKRSLPTPIAETRYLQNVVGDKEIRKGDGMELDQLTENLLRPEEKKGIDQIDVLADVFHIHKTATARLSTPDGGTLATATKLESKSKDRHHKNRVKHKNKHKTKDKKDPSEGIDDDEAKDMKRDGLLMNGQDPLKRQEKKRKHNGIEFQPRAQRRQQPR